MLEAVIFDVDGTLADTEREGHRVVFNTAFREFGGGKERIRAYVERNHPALLSWKDFDAWIALLHAAKTRHFTALLQQPGMARASCPARFVIIE